jgi:Periplasmic binding protein
MTTWTGIALISLVAASTISAAHAEILIGMPGPMTGGMAWFGEQMQEGIGMKVAELNEVGGVLGQQVELLPVDDYCDPEQAIAAAHKWWEEGGAYVREIGGCALGCPAGGRATIDVTHEARPVPAGSPQVRPDRTRDV